MDRKQETTILCMHAHTDPSNI